ncbi:MAG TPA: metalloregulator ArsR/SmtB family transcription factor [Pelolinea sp.]|nr:metalloregulator ArsR/SmtB family transcription factor [Pelolinea sp.]
MNMKSQLFEKRASKILAVMGNPFRVKLVLALRDKEACVCHLETLLKKRQAYISQHLMALREAGLLETRREGKFVYYRLSKPEVIKLIQDAARLAGIDPEDLTAHIELAVLEKCICPHCESEEGINQKIVSNLDAASII